MSYLVFFGNTECGSSLGLKGINHKQHKCVLIVLAKTIKKCNTTQYMTLALSPCRSIMRKMFCLKLLYSLSFSHSFLFVCPHSCVSSSVPDDYIGRRNLEHVEALQENPLNPNQVVIGYGRGLMVIWDLEKHCAIQHIPATQVTAMPDLWPVLNCTDNEHA